MSPLSSDLSGGRVRRHSVRKYVALILVVAASVAADYLTKQWAYTSLASEDHPQPIVIGPDEAGLPAAAVVGARYPDLEDPAETTEKFVRRVDRTVRPTAAQGAFAPLDRAGKRRVPLAYTYFHEGWDRAPRVVLLVEKPLLRRWLGFLFSGLPRVEVEAHVAAAFEGTTLAGYLAGHVSRYDEGDIAAAIEDGRVLPLFTHRRGVDPDRPVAEGELYLLTERRVDVIPGLLRFDYKENPGAAWGLMASQPPAFRQYVLCGVSSLAALIILIVFLRLHATHWSAILAFSAILSGAVGNLIDRARYNFVVDFIDMYISYMHWPTYNVADIAIMLGVVALVVEMLFIKSSPFAQGATPTLPDDVAGVDDIDDRGDVPAVAGEEAGV